MWRILQRTKANSFEDESIQRCDWLNRDQESPEGFEPYMPVCAILRYDFADDGQTGRDRCYFLFADYSPTG